MNVGDYIETFRRERVDVEEPHFWSDDEIVDGLNGAVQEANERALLTEEWVNPDVCEVALSAGVGLYDLHRSVLQIKQATYLGRCLREVSFEELHSSWRTSTGQPCEFVFLPAQGKSPPRVQLVPAPFDAGVLQLGVYRGALRPLDANNPSGVPDIPPRFHRQLLDWVYRCALLKQDAETLNQDKAAEHEAIFERNFGKRPDANVQRKRNDKRPPLVVSSW